MENNKKLIIGISVVAVIVGIYFYNKKKTVKTYSKECIDSLERSLMFEVVRPPNYEKTFLENCDKNKSNK